MESLYIADLLAGKEDRIGKYYYCFDPTILTPRNVQEIRQLLEHFHDQPCAGHYAAAVR